MPNGKKTCRKGRKVCSNLFRGWDSHDYLERGHSARIKSVDKPMAALIKDLKNRGMLDSTLVVWTGEFGRTPDNNRRGGVYALGRGHNIDAMTMMFAGGGVKKGSIVGATDDIGAKATEVVHPVRDLHVTILHLLGLDDNKLTYFHGGRYKQLSNLADKSSKILTLIIPQRVQLLEVFHLSSHSNILNLCDENHYHFISIFLGVICNAELRIWTAVNDKTVEAEFASLEKGTVKLKLKTGKIVEVPISKFRKDRELIKKLSTPENPLSINRPPILDPLENHH